MFNTGNSEFRTVQYTDYEYRYSDIDALSDSQVFFNAEIGSEFHLIKLSFDTSNNMATEDIHQSMSLYSPSSV